MLNIINYENLLYLVGQKTLKIILYLIAGEIAKKIIAFLIKKIRLAPEKISQTNLENQKKRIKTITNLITNTSKIIINFTIFIMVLAELGVNIAPLITGAGILGLAVGFGARSLVADLISGFFIILENQFNIGDQVKIGTNKGKVIKISLRTITLKDKDRNIYIIPNSTIKSVIKLPKKNIKN